MSLKLQVLEIWALWYLEIVVLLKDIKFVRLHRRNKRGFSDWNSFFFLYKYKNIYYSISVNEMFASLVMCSHYCLSTITIGWSRNLFILSFSLLYKNKYFNTNLIFISYITRGFAFYINICEFLESYILFLK